MCGRNDYHLEGDLKKVLIGSFDRAGRAFFKSSISTPDPSRIRKILLIRLDHVGDVLMTTPAIRALRRTFPAAEIHLIVKEETYDAVALNPQVNRVIVFNAPWTVVRGPKASPVAIGKLISLLKKEQYDCVVDFRGDIREALLVLFTRAPCRIGYGCRGGGFAFTRLVPFDPGLHAVRQNVRLLEPLGVSGDGDGMDLYLSPQDEEEAVLLLTRMGIGHGDKAAGIHPGAASPFKRWGAEGFARAGDRLAERGYRVVLLGGRDEEQLAREVAGKMKTRSAAACGLPLRVLAASIKRLDLLVCNDTAPSHIAQAVGTRSVVIFGPTHEEITGPLDREKHRAVAGRIDCRPCWRPGGVFSCTRNLRCFKEITPDMVMEAAGKLID